MAENTLEGFFQKVRDFVTDLAEEVSESAYDLPDHDPAGEVLSDLYDRLLTVRESGDLPALSTLGGQLLGLEILNDKSAQRDELLTVAAYLVAHIENGQ